MNDDLRVNLEVRDKTVILAPEGDIDLSRSPMLRQSLRSAQANKPSRLVVDLSQVDYMDSSGVATLIEALQIARRNQTELVLCGLRDRVKSVIEIARLDTVFSIAASRETALS